jgi:SAM-dependent methyltransferase
MGLASRYVRAPAIPGGGIGGAAERSQEFDAMDRRLEPELMDDEGQVEAYVRADFSESNAMFVDAVARAAARGLRSAIDIGCGPGNVTIQLAHALPELRLTALDGSGPMIALARRAVRAAALDDRITLAHSRIPGAPLAPHAFDAVLSKDLLHHLEDPGVLWNEALRLGVPGALVCVMDLVRPETPEAARRIVTAVAGQADPILQQDFYNSLCAAFTLEEVRAQLAAASLDLRVERIGNRHMIAEGRLP